MLMLFSALIASTLLSAPTGDTNVVLRSAAEIELCVTFSDGTEITDSTSIYEIGGEYVSTELIDAASLLIQLIYF